MGYRAGLALPSVSCYAQKRRRCKGGSRISTSSSLPMMSEDCSRLSLLGGTSLINVLCRMFVCCFSRREGLMEDHGWAGG